MKKLYLTSSVNQVAHHLAKDLDLTSENKLAFIDTAAEIETGSKKWLENDRQALVDAGFSVFDYTISNKTIEQLKQDLSDSDYLYLSGGNTYYLLQQAQQSGFDSLIQEYVLNQEKIYISTSAGSIIAGPDTTPAIRLDKLEVAPLLQGYKGFNLVNFCVLPHWGSNTFKDLYLNHRLDHAYKKGSVPLFLLTDTQYIKVNGDSFTVVDCS